MGLNQAFQEQSLEGIDYAALIDLIQIPGGGIPVTLKNRPTRRLKHIELRSSAHDDAQRERDDDPYPSQKAKGSQLSAKTRIYYLLTGVRPI